MSICPDCRASQTKLCEFHRTSSNNQEDEADLELEHLRARLLEADEELVRRWERIEVLEQEMFYLKGYPCEDRYCERTMFDIADNQESLWCSGCHHAAVAMARSNATVASDPAPPDDELRPGVPTEGAEAEKGSTASEARR